MLEGYVSDQKTGRQSEYSMRLHDYPDRRIQACMSATLLC